MSDILIQELGQAGVDGWQVKVVCGSYKEICNVRDPVADGVISEDDLTWVLERHGTSDSSETTRARTITGQTFAYGRALMDHLDCLPFAMIKSIQTLRNRSEEPITIEVRDLGPTSSFHRLHWEVIEHESYWGNNPFLVGATPISIRRTTLADTSDQDELIEGPWPAMKQKFNILLVVSRSFRDKDIDPQLGAMTIMKTLSRLPYVERANIMVDMIRPGTWDAVRKRLTETTALWKSHGGIGPWYNLVHFDVHGEVDARNNACLRFLTKKTGKPLNRLAGAVASTLVEHEIENVVLNACETAKVTQEMQSNLAKTFVSTGISSVLAMSFRLPSSSALMFLSAFYANYLKGSPRDLVSSAHAARAVLARDTKRQGIFGIEVHIPDYMIPVVYTRRMIFTRHDGPSPYYSEERINHCLALIHLHTKTNMFRLARGDANLMGIDKFITSVKGNSEFSLESINSCLLGRGEDILRLENVILMNPANTSRVVLIHGEPGAGKSALVMSLCWWWVVTGLVEDSVFFNADPDPAFPGNFPRGMTDLGSSKDVEIEALVKKRYLVVIDNIDYGSYKFSHRSTTFTIEDRFKMSGFVAQVAGGQSILLLVSRSTEPWLTSGIQIHKFELESLAPIQALRMAEDILTQLGMTLGRESRDSAHYLILLVNQLNFNPLAIRTALKYLRDKLKPLGKGSLQVLYQTLWRDSIPLTDDHGCFEFVQRVEHLGRPVKLALHSLFIFSNAFREDWLSYFAEQCRSIGQHTSSDLGGHLEALLESGWLSVCAEYRDAGVAPGERYIMIHPVLTNIIRDRVSVENDKDFISFVQHCFLEFVAQRRNADWLALIGSEDRTSINFIDMHSDYPFLKHEFYNILTAADIFSEQAPWSSRIWSQISSRTFYQIRVPEMLKILRGHAESKKGWRADRHRLHHCTMNLATAYLNNMPDPLPTRLLRAVGDLVCWISWSLVPGNSEIPRNLIQKISVHVDNCLRAWTPASEHMYGGVNKPWILNLKALLLVERAFAAMHDGDVQLSHRCFCQAWHVDFESDEPRWSLEKVNLRNIIGLGMNKLRLESSSSSYFISAEPEFANLAEADIEMVGTMPPSIVGRMNILQSHGETRGDVDEAATQQDRQLWKEMESAVSAVGTAAPPKESVTTALNRARSAASELDRQRVFIGYLQSTIHSRKPLHRILGECQLFLLLSQEEQDATVSDLLANMVHADEDANWDTGRRFGFNLSMDSGVLLSRSNEEALFRRLIRKIPLLSPEPDAARDSTANANPTRG
ncbi:hypothetical protein AbraIFM66951_004875 [Aspergillus brasiliensis]|uniref:AAA+ ATPase domain-containing protein n=1 Tax=Aspergillus brasiliensis TaxID=319629 RepID=A0A9W5Z462_9EURO|nr:hypothetical protein AbraCBS73388_004059 [Aspergillus brasiliensis]GKZ51062.1 hypothetical protein AbraIFM66951_004875 [Aspergillus brasiliensis]